MHFFPRIFIDVDAERVWEPLSQQPGLFVASLLVGEICAARSDNSRLAYLDYVLELTQLLLNVIGIFNWCVNC